MKSAAINKIKYENDIDNLIQLINLEAVGADKATAVIILNTFKDLSVKLTTIKSLLYLAIIDDDKNDAVSVINNYYMSNMEKTEYNEWITTFKGNNIYYSDTLLSTAKLEKLVAFRKRGQQSIYSACAKLNKGKKRIKMIHKSVLELNDEMCK